jgi:hypothetical protein
LLSDELSVHLNEQIAFFLSILARVPSRTPSFLGEVVLTITALIPNAIYYFGQADLQHQLLEVIGLLLGAVPDVPFCTIT